MKPSPKEPPAGPPVDPGPAPRALRVPPAWFAAGFFVFATLLLFVWWDRFPIHLEILGEYWRREKPFLRPAFPAFFRVWGSNALAMLALAAGQAACWLLGRWVLRWVKGSARLFAGEWGAVWSVLIALGIGNGMTGSLTLGLGFAGLVFKWWTWAGVAGVLGLAWRSREWRRDPLTWVPDPGGPPDGPVLPSAPGAAARLSRWVERGVLAGCALLAAGCLAGVVLAYEFLLVRGAASFTFTLVFAGFAVLGVAVWALLDQFLPPAGARRWVDRALLAFCAFVAVGNWLPAFQPEWFYDALVYHLAVPERYLLHHKICHLSDTFISNYPFQQEMMYLFHLALGHDVSAKLLHWLDGIYAAAGAFALAGCLAGRTAGWLAAAVFLSQPTLRFLHHVSMVELALSWYEILAVMAFVAAMGWLPQTGVSSVKSEVSGCAGGQSGAQLHTSYFRLDTSSWAWFVLTGWFLGLAHGTKYVGLFCSGIVLFWMAVSAVRSGIGWRRLAVAGALVVGVASAWTGTWLGKNWLFTADPFYPFLDSVFPTLNWTEENQARWMGDNTKYGTVHGWPRDWPHLRKWLEMPTMASIDVSQFGTFTLNAFPMLFIPLLFFYRGPPAAAVFLAVYSGMYFLFWGLFVQQVRFLLPMMGPAAVAVSFVAVRLGRGSLLARSVLGFAAAWILVMSAFGEVVNRQSNTALVRCLTGQLDRLGLLRAGVSYYRTLEGANEVMDPRARLLFLGSDESFYGRTRRLCNSIYDRQEIGEMAARAKDAAGLLDLLRRRRITHMLVHVPRCEEYINYGIFEWGERAIGNFLDMWHTYGRLRMVFNGVFLFEFRPEPIPVAERKTGKPSFFHAREDALEARLLVGHIDQLWRETRNLEALEACHRLVRLIPGASHAYSYRAYAYSQVGKYREAAADYERAIKLEYPTAVVYFNLGVLQEGERKYAQALENYVWAVEMEPEGMGVARDRGLDLAVYLNKYGVALKLGEAALKANPGDAVLRERVERLRTAAAAEGKR